MEDKIIKLGVSGALGKMGQRILDLASKDRAFDITLAMEHKGHQQIGSSMYGVKISCDKEQLFNVDCLIDFSTPEATLDNLEAARKFKKPVVIGTTGFSDELREKILVIAKEIPVVFSPNMSIGVNLLFNLVAEAANKLPPEYKVMMTEAHHVHKKDSPSGTAKFLADIVKKERKLSDVDIKSIREGEIVGDHEVVFDSPWDVIKLSHSAKTRDIFAKGALEAAKFIVKKKKGLFGMGDVLRGI